MMFPPLPKTDYVLAREGDCYTPEYLLNEAGYSDDQMRAYAEAAVAQERERGRQPVAWIAQQSLDFLYGGGPHARCTSELRLVPDVSDVALFVAPPPQRTGEPEWNSVDQPLKYVTECADGTRFLNFATMPAHAVRWRTTAAVLAEREACAKVCERLADEADERRPLDGSVGEALRAAAIRTRSKS
jgi:hypothetical protein